jgi:hypothetical protein
MFKMMMIMLLMIAAFVAGAWYSERESTDPVSRAVHQAANRVETVRQDLVARQRNLESRDEHRQRMMQLAERVIQMMERQVDHHNKVALQQQRHDNTHNEHNCSNRD